MTPIRRVITGHDAKGKSIVLSDGQTTTHNVGGGRMPLYDIWHVARLPAPIEAAESDPTDKPLDFEIPKEGVRIRYLDVPPAGENRPFMHRTESLDVVVVIDGEICMPMDDTEVVLRTGDVLVQRGTNHAWVNRSDRPCRVLYIIMAAKLSDGLMRSLGIEEIVWDAASGGTGHKPTGETSTAGD